MLIIIPARAGSKGLPGKNVKKLGGIPLIAYSFEFAKEICSVEDHICVSSNDEQVLQISKKYGIEPDFVRAEELSNDKTSMFDVLKDAVLFYENRGKIFDKLLLLQPTSPFRRLEDFKALKLAYESGCEMAVSVVSAKENPYFTLFEQKEGGYIIKSKPADFVRRQDCPPVYALNGSMYMVNIESMKKYGSLGFEKIKMAEMPKQRSVDIDDLNDFNYAQYLMKNIENEDN
jgi:N-acylneuraminate cytidylyltransferase